MHVIHVIVLKIVMLTMVSPTVAANKPNVLFIAIDDMRPETGSYGSEQAVTPNLDGIAKRAMVFDRAYCQVPVCGASRASLMTGVLPTKDRFTGFRSRAEEDAPLATTLPQAFKEAGYTTISNGKVFHNLDDSQAQSWSEPAWRPQQPHSASFDPATLAKLSKRERGRFYEMPEVADDAYADGKVAAKTISDLKRLKAAGKPFFLACGFIRPHLPFYAPKKYWDLYDAEKIKLADNRERPKNAPQVLRGSGEYRSYHLADMDVNSDAFHRMMRLGYLASVSYVDQLVGDVLDELEKLNLQDDTIVVIWGDHGWHLGEHNFWGKHNTMHLSTRVPLIIKVPGKQPGKTQAIVETSDLFPTLCTLAGLDVPKTVQGRSFDTVFAKPDQPFRDAAYSRFGRGDAIITERFNYTNYADGKAEMLYDLEEDPDENVNVAGDPAYAETLQRMRALLDERKAQAASAKVKSH